jgi:glucokinase
MARDAALAVGLDIGGTKILGVAVDLGTGTRLAEQKVATPTGRDEVVEALGHVVDALAAEVGRRPVGVGIGAAGLVDVDGVLRYGPNLPGVVDLDLRGALHERTGVAVVVDNDATTATVAEHRLGAARGVADVVYVALGTGIGGGIVLDGAVRRGAHGFGGELGHMMIDRSGPLCACGRRGCWEAIASGTALGRLARRAVDDGRAPGVLAAAGGVADAVGGEQAVAAAAEGDPGAQAVLEEYAGAVAVGIVSLVNALDPAVVVIGGGVVEAGDLLMSPLREIVHSQVMGATHRPFVPVVPAAFGGRSAAIGAAVMAGDLV